MKNTTLEHEVLESKRFIIFCVLPFHLALGFTGVTHGGLHDV